MRSIESDSPNSHPHSKRKERPPKGKTPPPESKLTRSKSKAPATGAAVSGSGQKYPYYGIAVGREVKVSTDWPETRSLVNGWPGNRYKGFHDLKQAWLPIVILSETLDLRRGYEASFPPNQVNDSNKGSNG